MDLRPVTHWPAEALWEAIEPLLPGFSVEVLPEVDSTNTELMRRARAGRLEPVLLVAERQTAGRGRMGRVWQSEGPGQPESGPVSLTFSLSLPVTPIDWSGLSLAVGLCVAEALDPEAGSGLGLKWPNDLWLQDRKLGGILIETAGAGGTGGSPAVAPRQVVIGIGLNVKPRAAEGLSTPPASLSELPGAPGAAQALGLIVPPLVQTVLAFARHGFDPLRARFEQRDVLRGRQVLTSEGLQGRAVGVDAGGALLVHTAQGVQALHSSEVSVRPAQPPA